MWLPFWTIHILSLFNFWGPHYSYITILIYFIHVGEFGIVYKGYVKKSDSHSIDEYLAIKTLKGMFARIYHYFSLLNPLYFQPQNNYL